MKFYVWSLLIGVLFVGCGPRNVNTTPQAQIAHYGTDVIKGVNEVQAVVIKLSDGGTITVEQATPWMDRIRAVLVNAQKLDDALKLYDSLNIAAPERKPTGQQVLMYVNLIAGALGQFNQLPTVWGEAGQEVSKLILNINQALTQTKLALASNGIAEGQ
jgi:hypothetical protein